MTHDDKQRAIIEKLEKLHQEVKNLNLLFLESDNMTGIISTENQIAFYRLLKDIISKKGVEPKEAWSLLVLAILNNGSFLKPQSPFDQAVTLTELEGHRIAAIQSHEIIFKTENT